MTLSRSLSIAACLSVAVLVAGCAGSGNPQPVYKSWGFDGAGAQ
ncbi:MAG: hypothetical protein AAF360_06765 [Pseudomonadota bacterium]